MTKTTEIEKDGRTYLREEYPNGTIVEQLKPLPVSQPEYKTFMSKENTTKIKTGVMTDAERDKLLVAIALKLGVLK